MSKDLKYVSDEELYGMLGASREQAHAAFDELYGRHAPRVYTYCCRMLGDDMLAEDVCQEVLIRFISSARVERKMLNAPAYLLRIARNRCLNERRRRHYSNVSLDEFQFPVNDRPFESTELARLIETAMETLPDEYREALILKEHMNLTYNEIAEVVGTTMPVIRTRIYRAKNKLRDILSPYLEDLQK